MNNVINKVEQNKSNTNNGFAQADQVTKYDINNIYVGYLAKRAVQKIDGKEALKQIVKSQPILLYPVELNYLKAIEEDDKYYPLIYIGEKPSNDDYYVPERFLDTFVNICAETLFSLGINDDVQLTVKELKEIMEKQEFLKQICFS